MNTINFHSKLLEAAVEEFSKLPGIGKRTALRLVLHLLKQEKDEVQLFSDSIQQLKNNIKQCTHCNNISDTEVCNICASPIRDHSTICVVETIKDVMSIEDTMQYTGVYFVLGGVISPIDGIGPGDLKIDKLENKIEEGNVKEVIFALSTTMEGDTTNFYLFKKLNKYPVKITTIARGIAIGDELDYADEITLGRSIVNRTLFEDTFATKI